MATFSKIVEYYFFRPKEKRLGKWGKYNRKNILTRYKNSKKCSKNCDSPFVSADGYLWIDFVVI